MLNAWKCITIFSVTCLSFTENLQWCDKPLPFRNRYYFSTFVYPTPTGAKCKETVRQPSLESSQEMIKTPLDESLQKEPNDNNKKEIKDPQSELKVVTTIVNSSFYTYIQLIYTIFKLWQWWLVTVINYRYPKKYWRKIQNSQRMQHQTPALCRNSS